jgi:putative ABC transport system permease protein
VEGWRRDLVQAARSLLAAKKFTAIVVATLALGLGANTAVFGVLNAVVLQPLPYPEPDRLVRVYHVTGTDDNYLPGLTAIAYRDQSQTLDLAAVYTYRAEGVDLTDRAQPERVQSLRVSANYFGLLGVEPIAGRAFEPADERSNSNVAVVKARIWREYLGGSADAIGRMLSLNGVPARVVAVLPDDFEDPLQPGVQVWMPVNMQPGGQNSWDNNYLTVVGRLRGSVTLQQAQAELSAISVRLQPNYGQNVLPRSVRVAPLQADTVGRAGLMLWLLFGAVGLLLVVACVNVAGLVLARGVAREPELAIRAALGSSRWQLVRELLIESVLLSLAGGAAGLLLAQGVTRMLMAAAPETVARAGNTATGSVVFAFGFGVAVLAGLAFGIVPALKFARPGIERVLRDSSRGASTSRRQTRMRSALVVCQTALALVLLIGAGLLLRSFQRLSAVNLGIRPDNVMTFEVHLPGVRYGDPVRRTEFHVDLQRRIAAIPGVRAAAAVSRLPVTGTYHSWGTRRPDRPRDPRSLQVEHRVIEGPYFQALGISLLRGRTFDASDRASADAPRQVVVNQALMTSLFGSEDPIGRQVRAAGELLEIIGVVSDVALTPRGIVHPVVYHSHRQFASNRNWALVHMVALERPMPGLMSHVRRELAAIDPALVLYQPQMLSDVIGAGVAQERFALFVIGSYATLALTLAAIGMYGVLSYTVGSRRREIGIRVALGAQRGSVRGLVVRDGMRLAVAGTVIGLGVAYLATRALGPWLFQISATEPTIYAASAVVLVAAALLASWIPARTATNVDPLQALRSET